MISSISWTIALHLLVVLCAFIIGKGGAVLIFTDAEFMVILSCVFFLSKKGRAGVRFLGKNILE